MAKRNGKNGSKYEIPDDPRDIVIEDIGPHARLNLKAPPGRITVLTGPNGAGKTQVLEAVDAAQRGGKRLASRDGTVGGSARFGGVKIKVARGGTNRRSGELLVQSLEDRLSIDQFVDPGLKDPAAADEQRIRALLLLAGVEADVTRFYELTGGDRDEFMRIVSPESVEEKDVVKMAARIKRDFEAQARKVEDVLGNVERERDGKVESNEGIDLTQPHDEAELEAARDDARDKWTELKERRRAGQLAREAAEAAQDLLNEAAAGGVPTIDAAQAAVESAKDALVTQRMVIEELNRKLRDAESKARELQTEFEAAKTTLAAAQGHADALAGWRATIEAGAVKYPKQESVDAAEEEYLAAKAKAENGVRIRDALKRKAEIDVLTAKLTRLAQEADTYRSAARNTQVVLSRMVGDLGVPLKVDGECRLIANHPGRGDCYFDELSMGEKWKLGLDIVLSAAAEEPALLVIPQEAWESLDARNRHSVSAQIDGTNLSILTAEAQQTVECPACGAINDMSDDVCADPECGVALPEPALVAATYGGDA